MPAYKDAQKGTWYAAFYYQDWKGVKKKKLKRGFPTKKEALAWERTFLLQQAADLTMTFEAFVEIYIVDKQNRLRENTWSTKEHTENIVELQNQLTAEITARQKQYEFYRDKLLTFDVLRGGQLIFDGGCSAKSQTLVQVIAIRTRRWKMANIRFLFVLRNRCEKTILSMISMNFLRQ